MGRPRASSQKSRKSARRQQAKEDVRGPQLLSGGQRWILWVMWLAVLGLLIAGTNRESLSLAEFGAIVAGTGITVWMCRHPQGGPKKFIEQPEDVRGEFVSRTNWPLVLLGVGLTLGGLAGLMKAIQDVSNGLTTIWGVLEDMVMFVLEWIKIQLSKGVEGDVTRTKMYTLMLLLPIGVLMLLFLSPPFLFRGMRFRVNEDGTIEYWSRGEWKLLDPADYAEVTADAFTIDFKRKREEPPEVVLPQGRVFSIQRGTKVEREVLGTFFRKRVEERGFVVEPSDPDVTPGLWQARRRTAKDEV